MRPIFALSIQLLWLSSSKWKMGQKVSLGAKAQINVPDRSRVGAQSLYRSGNRRLRRQRAAVAVDEHGGKV
jgi:hypothetical protein